MDYSKYQIVEIGDFAMNHMDLLTGWVDIAIQRGVTSPDYRVFCLRSNSKNESKYFLSLFQNGYKAKIFFAFGQGSSQLGRWRLPTDQFNNFWLPVPPLPEQTAIASFLDRETGKIDALVSEQERLISLLKEKRQALISHAVTKGLDPKAQMKPSGVEWLGDVPQGWEVKRLGLICGKIGSGKTPAGGSEVYSDEGIVFIRSQNVYDDGLRLDDVVYISPTIDSEMYWSRVMPGDILLNITGASLGRTCLVPSDFQGANVNQHVCIIRVTNPLFKRFVSLAMKSESTKIQIELAQTGAAREGLNFAQISHIVICLPPLPEQDAIAAFLDRETGKIDALMQEAECGIELLKERRSALISAAVTGKIDVRGLG
jgi:type I restriction enzyme, S subunit